VRSHVDGLISPHPIGPTLPAMLVEDPFAQRFVAGIDDVLAPLISTLDNLVAYLDPWLAPEDFLAWLADWVGVTIDPAWPLARRRAVVAQAADLYAWRGTARGLADHVEAVTGVRPEIRESGATSWSRRPGTSDAGPMGGAGVVVVLPVPRLSDVDRTRLERLVRAAVPAHVPVRLEVESS
jgi:phage tail-like protein